MCLVLAYTLLFSFLYKNYLVPRNGYLGYVLNNENYFLEGICHLIIVVMSLFLPLDFKKASDLFVIFIFQFLLIPSVFVFYFISTESLGDKFVFIFILCISFLIISLLSKIKIRIISINTGIDLKILNWVIFIVTFILLFYIFLTFRGSLKLVSFSDVYEQRLNSNATTLVNSMVAYSSFFCSGCFIPFLYALSLFKKNILGLFICILALIFLYSTLAGKTIIISIFLIPFFFWIGKKFYKNIIFWFLGFSILLSAFLYLFHIFSKSLNFSFELIIGEIADLYIMRIYSIQGLLTYQYYDFFSNNPFTYFSHIKGPSLFLNNPYSKDLGIIVAERNYDTYMNTNASFWSMDGFASMGIIGVLLVSVFYGLFLIFLNSVSSKHSLMFVSSVLSVSVMTSIDTAFFTSLLTGGIGLLLIILMIYPAIQSQNSYENT